MGLGSSKAFYYPFPLYKPIYVKVCIPIVCKTCFEFKIRMNLRKMVFRAYAENSTTDFDDTQFDV